MSQAIPLGFGPVTKLIGRAIMRQGWTLTQYAHALGHAGNGFVSQVLKGERRIPEDAIELWLRPLQLTNAEYSVLHLEALKQFASDYVKDLIERFHAAIQDREQRIWKLEAEMKRPASRFPTLAEVASGRLNEE